MSTIIDALDKARREKDRAKLGKPSEAKTLTRLVPPALRPASSFLDKRLHFISIVSFVISVTVLGLAVYFFFHIKPTTVGEERVTLRTASVPESITKPITTEGPLATSPLPQESTTPAPPIASPGETGPELVPAVAPLSLEKQETVAEPPEETAQLASSSSTEPGKQLTPEQPAPVVAPLPVEKKAETPEPVKEPVLVPSSTPETPAPQQPEQVKPEPTSEASPAPEPEVTEAKNLNLKIDGILSDEEKPLAVINNKLVGEGEYIGEIKIVKIHRDAVTVEKEGKTYILLY